MTPKSIANLKPGDKIVRTGEKYYFNKDFSVVTGGVYTVVKVKDYDEHVIIAECPCKEFGFSLNHFEPYKPKGLIKRVSNVLPRLGKK